MLNSDCRLCVQHVFALEWPWQVNMTRELILLIRGLTLIDILSRQFEMYKVCGGICFCGAISVNIYKHNMKKKVVKDLKDSFL